LLARDGKRRPRQVDVRGARSQGRLLAASRLARRS
jgi:hypothetical protein